MDETLPPSHRHHTGTARNPHNYSKLFLIIFSLLVLCGLSFYGGTSYQKDHTPKTVTAATASANGFSGQAGSSGGFGRRFGGQRPASGQVTAISSSSITLQDSNTSSSQTFAITSSTTITDNGQSVTTSDIQTGDTVFVIANSSSAATASRIIVNPSSNFGGGSQQSQDSGPPPTATTD